MDGITIISELATENKHGSDIVVDGMNKLTDNNDQLQSRDSLLTGNNREIWIPRYRNVASMINDRYPWLRNPANIARTAPHFYMQMNSFHNTVLLILCSKISFFAVIYLLTHLFKSLQENSDTDDNSVLLLIIIPVTSVFIMLTFVNINDHYTLSAESNCLVSLSALFLLFFQPELNACWYSRRWA